MESPFRERCERAPPFSVEHDITEKESLLGHWRAFRFIGGRWTGPTIPKIRSVTLPGGRQGMESRWLSQPV
jgi:hypothetical protein